MNKKKFCKIFFPVLGTVVVVTAIYWSLIEFVLKDYQNIGYISFKYEENSENKKTGAYITGISQSSKYPAYFEVPRQVQGHPVVGIDDNAFYGLSRIETIVLPKSVTTIGDNAFGNCPNLKFVIVKGELTSVGVDIFEGSDNWKYDTVSDGNGGKFIMFEDFLYKYDGQIKDNTIIKSENDKGKNEVPGQNYLYIPSDVKELCSGSFKNQDGIVGVEVQSNYTKLEKEVFANCTNLKEVKINNITEISDSVFDGCFSLESIDLSNVTSIGSYAFNSTNLSVVTLSNKLTAINERTFANCENLENINIPASVTKIGNYAFENDTKITKMKLSDDVSVLGIGAFKNTRIETFKTPKHVETISSELFMNDEALKSIELVKDMEQTKVFVKDEFDNPVKDDDGNDSFVYQYTGIRTIGSNAFKGCSNLTSIEFPYKEFMEEGNDKPIAKSIVEIGESAFEGSGLVSFDVPKTLTRLDKAILKNCSNLTSVNFGKSQIATINAECFMGDTSLKTIAFPNSITVMQGSILSGCTSLTSVTLPTNHMFRTINNSFFEGCTSLTKVVVPSNVVALRNEAFKNCENLEDVQLLGRISTLGSGVFTGCSKLNQIIIGAEKTPTSGWTDGWNPNNVNVIYYSATEKAGCWHYDENNNVTLW